MRAFAGTFHRNRQGDWVKCITEGGKPCSRHCGGEHVKGADLEEALASYYDSRAPHGLHVGTDAIIHHVDASQDVADIARLAFPDTPLSDDDTALSDSADEAWNAMTPDERNAVLDYTDAMYKPVTEYLCNPDAAKDARLDEYVDTLHSALDRNSLSSDGIVFRRRFAGRDGLGERDIEERSCYDAVRDDGVTTKPNFSSTTTRPYAIGVGSHDDDHANATSYVIKVPKGTNGMYVNNYSYHRDEYEFLLNDHTRYRVVGIYERGTLHTDEEGRESWDVPPIIALEALPAAHGKERA
jgi:hypothetical protein